MNKAPLSLIKEYSINPSKRLGQNFLIDDNISSKIIEYCGDLTDKVVLEIGAGMGALTKQLADSNAKLVFALEYDKKCIAALQELAKFYPEKLHIISANALKFDENTLAKNNKISLISNLPYNISTVLMFKWLKKIYLFDRLTLMFQKEVAERIVSKPNNKSYGILSVLIQYLCDTSILFNVSPKSFYPEPKVDSSVITVAPKKDIIERLKLYDQLKTVCETLFNQRRKMIRSSLKKLVNNTDDILNKFHLEGTLRPENLSISDFVRLTQIIYNK